MVTGVVEIATVLCLVLFLPLISRVATILYTTYLPSFPPYTWQASFTDLGLG